MEKFKYGKFKNLKMEIYKMEILENVSKFYHNIQQISLMRIIHGLLYKPNKMQIVYDVLLL